MRSFPPESGREWMIYFRRFLRDGRTIITATETIMSVIIKPLQ